VVVVVTDYAGPGRTPSTPIYSVKNRVGHQRMTLVIRRLSISTVGVAQKFEARQKEKAGDKLVYKRNNQ
jgi:hypothetical protein